MTSLNGKREIARRRRKEAQSMPVELGLPRVKTDTVLARVHHELRRALMQSRFAPGQKLTLRQLADAFGVSTMPVRGAVDRLVAEGGLEMLLNRTFAVPAMTRERLLDLKQVRQLVEGAAAAWAAPVITDGELDRLTRLAAHVDEVIEERTESRMETHLARFQEFRFELYRIAGSSLLVAFVESLWLQVAPYFNVLRPHWDEVVRHSRHHREALLAALRARDGARARAIIETDIGGIVDLILQELPQAAEPSRAEGA
jgi:DNA-binding GntR family transcriptional regulator